MPRSFNIESRISVQIWEKEVDALEQVGRHFRLYWSCPVEIARNNDGILYLRYNEARAESGYTAQQFKNVFHGVKLVLPEGDTSSSSSENGSSHDDDDERPDEFQTASEFVPPSEADTIILPASARDVEDDNVCTSTPRGRADGRAAEMLPSNAIKTEAEETLRSPKANDTHQANMVDVSTQCEAAPTPEGPKAGTAGDEDSHSPSLLARSTPRVLRSHTKKLQERK
jgi:hypothetical protein